MQMLAQIYTRKRFIQNKITHRFWNYVYLWEICGKYLKCFIRPICCFYISHTPFCVSLLWKQIICKTKQNKKTAINFFGLTPHPYLYRYLKAHGQQLTSAQMSQVTGAPLTGSPLVICATLEHLRMHSSFEQLDVWLHTTNIYKRTIHTHSKSATSLVTGVPSLAARYLSEHLLTLL